MNDAPPKAGCDRAAWLLDPRFTFLNHGSFGATPRTVLAEQDAWRRRMEAHPGDFFANLPRLLREAAQGLAACLGGAGDDYVFVENATAGCNAVLASLSFAAGDEILLTDHAYPAIQRAAEHLARRTGVRVVTAQVPYPARPPPRSSRRSPPISAPGRGWPCSTMSPRRPR